MCDNGPVRLNLIGSFKTTMECFGPIYIRLALGINFTGVGVLCLVISLSRQTPSPVGYGVVYHLLSWRREAWVAVGDCGSVVRHLRLKQEGFGSIPGSFRGYFFPSSWLLMG